MTDKHTPTPWEIEGYEVYAQNEAVAMCETEADAAHIVRCVNAHDGLVEALSEYEKDSAEAEAKLAAAREAYACWLASAALANDAPAPAPRIEWTSREQKIEAEERGMRMALRAVASMLREARYIGPAATAEALASKPDRIRELAGGDDNG